MHRFIVFTLGVVFPFFFSFLFLIISQNIKSEVRFEAGHERWGDVIDV